MKCDRNLLLFSSLGLAILGLFVKPVQAGFYNCAICTQESEKAYTCLKDCRDRDKLLDCFDSFRSLEGFMDCCGFIDFTTLIDDEGEESEIATTTSTTTTATTRSSSTQQLRQEQQPIEVVAEEQAEEEIPRLGGDDISVLEYCREAIPSTLYCYSICLDECVVETSLDYTSCLAEEIIDGSCDRDQCQQAFRNVMLNSSSQQPPEEEGEQDQVEPDDETNELFIDTLQNIKEYNCRDARDHANEFCAANEECCGENGNNCQSQLEDIITCLVNEVVMPMVQTTYFTRPAYAMWYEQQVCKEIGCNTNNDRRRNLRLGKGIRHDHGRRQLLVARAENETTQEDDMLGVAVASTDTTTTMVCRDKLALELTLLDPMTAIDKYMDCLLTTTLEFIPPTSSEEEEEEVEELEEPTTASGVVEPEKEHQTSSASTSFTRPSVILGMMSLVGTATILTIMT